MINCHPIFANYITKNLNLPTVCPCCGVDLTITESGFVECQNMSCKNKVKHMFAEFFTKLEVEGAGEGFIENLAAEKKTITEVLQMSNTDFYNVIMSKNGYKIHMNLHKALAKPMTLAKFVSLFDLRGFGEKKFLDLDQLAPFKGVYEEPEAVLAGVTAEDLKKHHPASMVSEDVIAKFAFEFCLKREDMVNAIKTGLVKLEAAKNVEVKDGKLTGKSFCFTGKAEAIGSRSKCEELVIANGGTISSVKKGLSFLVTDDTESGSSKNKKAKELGIPVITSFEFKAMIEG
jgi:DNA ligase (NAD+)